MKNRKISRYIMFGIGFFILLINAISYTFNLDFKNPSLVVVGLVFVVIGFSGISKNS